MIDYLIAFDEKFTLTLSGLIPHSQFTDLFFRFLSFQGVWVIIWLIVLFFYIRKEERNHHLFTMYFFSSFLVAYIFSNEIIKNIVGRLRPWVVWHLSSTYCPLDYGFPSTHAATAWALAVICSHFDKKHRLFYYLLAVLISYSRVYLYCHYFLDILAGGILGYLISTIILRVSLQLKHRKFKG